MNNNTKIRLRLSKNLFESLTREILAEAKVNDGYSVAVKQPKTPKQSKSQATSPEVQKTDAETKMEVAPVAAKQSGPATTGTLRKNLLQKAQEVPKLSGISSKEVAGLEKLLNTILAKAPSGELAMAIDKAQRALDISTQNIKAGDQKSSGTAQQTHSPGSDYTQGSFMGKRGEEKPSKFTSGVAKPAANQRFEEMETKVAENTLKEYEHHYEMVNGQCRRYNDEGEYEVVSSHYCR